MEIKEIQHLADLSYLSFSEEELKKFKDEFEKMLLFVGQVADAEIGSEQEKSVSKTLKDLRRDEVKESLSNEEVLGNAPKARGGCFVVPQVVE